MLLDALLQDGHLSFAPFQEAVVEGVSEVQLGLFILVQTLVGLPRIHVLRCTLSLALVLCSVMAESERQEQLTEH